MADMLDYHHLQARAGLGGDSGSRPPVFKAVGISLAVASGLFIGTSFVLKKVGLLKANVKYNEEAGEGYGYLRNGYWWGGMILMIVGEICNFVAYAFVDAILVTPLGALSVVVTTILSAIFLKERLSFVGKIGCFSCILGSVVIALNAPEQSAVHNIQQMKDYVVTPGFLSYAGVIIVGCTFLALWAGPRYGKRNMFVYITICSLIGGLSVVATQGLGAAIIAQIYGESQFNKWFLYVVLVFVIVTLLTEIIYLNKALNIFNAALVTPTYYVVFTSATIITSAVLFQGFKGTAVTITTVVLGFLQICCGVVLLQLSKSAKDVPDAAVFKGDLDQVREVAEQEEPETEPKADAIRGTAAIARRISGSRRKVEETEARRYHEERKLDEISEPGENEIIEWDGLRRRRTVIGDTPASTPRRTKTVHPPWGMSHFPEEEDSETRRAPPSRSETSSIFSRAFSRASSKVLSPRRQLSYLEEHQELDRQPYAQIKDNNGLLEPFQYDDKKKGAVGATRERSSTNRSISWADEVKSDENEIHQSPDSLNSTRPPTPPPHGGRNRQFSFQRMLSPHLSPNPARSPGADGSTSEQIGNLRSAQEGRTRHLTSPFGRHRSYQRHSRNATEEESLGLVQIRERDDSPPEDADSPPTYSRRGR